MFLSALSCYWKEWEVSIPCSMENWSDGPHNGVIQVSKIQLKVNICMLRHGHGCAFINIYSQRLKMLLWLMDKD